MNISKLNPLIRLLTQVGIHTNGSLSRRSLVTLRPATTARRAYLKDLDPKRVELYHNEKLIMVDENDKVLGPIARGESHAIETVKKRIYHRALSFLKFDKQDGLLLTQRTTPKITKQSFANDDLKRKLNEEFEKSRKSLVTIPNILTMTRIATTPVIGYLICNGMHQQAIACIAFAATTDLLDGLIARAFKQTSDFGALMDPIADKLLLMTCFVAIYNVGLMPMWLVKGFMFRDISILVVGGAIRYMNFGDKITLKKFFDFRNHPTSGFEPTMLSKVNTSLQCLLVLLHLGICQMIQVPLDDIHLYILDLLTACTASVSLAQYATRVLFQTRLGPPKFKGF